MEASAQTTSYQPRGRTLFIALSAGFVAGALNAIVARLLMRGIALVAFGEGSFSLGGTAVIVLFGVLVGPLLGLIYVNTLYRLRTRDVAKGLLFGLILLLTLQALGLYISPEFRSELMAIGPIGFGAFAAMNLAFVLTLAFITPWLDKRWPHDGSRQRIQTVLSVVFGLLALAGLVLLVVEIGGRLLGVVQ